MSEIDVGAMNKALFDAKDLCLHCGNQHITATSPTTGCCDGERMDKGYLPKPPKGGTGKSAVVPWFPPSAASVSKAAAKVRQKLEEPTQDDLDPFIARAMQEASESQLLGRGEWTDDDVLARAKVLFKEYRRELADQQTDSSQTIEPEWMSKEEYHQRVKIEVNGLEAKIKQEADAKIAKIKAEKLGEEDIAREVGSKLRREREKFDQEKREYGIHQMKAMMVMGAAMLNVVIINFFHGYWQLLAAFPMIYIMYHTIKLTNKMRKQMKQWENEANDRTQQAG